MLEIQLLKERLKLRTLKEKKIKPVSTRIQRSETKRNLQWLFELDYQTFQDISLPSQWSNSHCPTVRFCSCWVEVILYGLTCTKRYERQWSCNASMITEYGKNMLVYTYEIDFLYKATHHIVNCECLKSKLEKSCLKQTCVWGLGSMIKYDLCFWRCRAIEWTDVRCGYSVMTSASGNEELDKGHAIR